jgi:deazaflavin-dependent oxidoreductase (nitroreductase family)
VSRTLDIVERSWPVLQRAMGAHTFLYRATGGVIGHTAPGLPTMLLLDHIGAKSGVKRTIPLLYVRDGDDIVLIASKGGYPKNPAWFYNLKANPETTVQVGREKRAVRARIATAEERPRLWQIAVDSWKHFDSYQARVPHREIPIVVLERR